MSSSGDPWARQGPLPSYVSVMGTVHGIMERAAMIRLQLRRVRMNQVTMDRLRGELNVTPDSVISEVFGLAIVVDDTCAAVTVEVVA